jgi:uncharacterized membrane protein YoaK (UPF0700 family)
MVYVGAIVGGFLGYLVQGKTLAVILAIVGAFLGYIYQEMQTPKKPQAS